MRQQILASLLSALLVAPGCAGGGSSSEGRSEEQGDQTSTGQIAEATPSDTTPMFVNTERVGIAEVPDVPDPEPMGWKEFDEYFQQLLVVHRSLIVGTLPKDEVEELQKRAEALASDQAPEREASRPMRDALKNHINDLSRSAGVEMPEEQRIEMFRLVINFTHDVMHGSGTSLTRGYIEKVENMLLQLESRLMEIRSKQ